MHAPCSACILNLQPIFTAAKGLRMQSNRSRYMIYVWLAVEAGITPDPSAPALHQEILVLYTAGTPKPFSRYSETHKQELLSSSILSLKLKICVGHAHTYHNVAVIPAHACLLYMPVNKFNPLQAVPCTPYNPLFIQKCPGCSIYKADTGSFKPMNQLYLSLQP